MRKILFLLAIVLLYGCKSNGSRNERDLDIINHFIIGVNKSFNKMGIEGNADYDGDDILINIYSDLSESEFEENFMGIEDSKEEIIEGLQGLFAKNKYAYQIIDVLTRNNCHIIYQFICYYNPELIASIDISPQELSE